MRLMTTCCAWDANWDVTLTDRAVVTDECNTIKKTVQVLAWQAQTV